jgi:PAS domain S-box-containing protein
LNAVPQGPDPGTRPGAPRELSTLTKAQLEDDLRVLTGPSSTGAVDRLQELVHELQVNRVELEMQNRALRDAQVQLEQSIQCYADLYDYSPLPYLTLTPTGRILQGNYAAGAMLGSGLLQLKEKHFAKYLDPYDAGRLAGHLDTCVQTRRPGTVELTLRLPDGGSLTVQLSSRLAREATGETPQILVAMADVTRLKQTQRTLEEINREQEAFNYSISHDLRAPLITINNYVGIVLSDYAAGMDAEGRAMFERIRIAGLRMEETLKHLLQYSTLAREDISIDVVNTDEVVRELLIEHRALVEESRAGVVVERPLPAIRGCGPLLNQVLGNLLTNAIKYTREGEAPAVRISAEPRFGTVVLRVADSGIGIEPKHHERIFRIFERLHGYSRYPGSGVGLAIARRAVERMSGRIWVESEVGKGSCFCLELPKA